VGVPLTSPTASPREEEMSARLLSRFLFSSKSGGLGGFRFARPGAVREARKLSCVPVDDLVSGLTDEQIEVKLVAYPTQQRVVYCPLLNGVVKDYSREAPNLFVLARPFLVLRTQNLQ